MKVLICESHDAAVLRDGRLIADHVRGRRDAVLGLATGSTMLPLYERLAALHRDGLSFDGVTTFNLDEYVGFAPCYPASYRTCRNDALFRHIDIDIARTHLPRGDAADPTAEAARYEASITEVGGLSLQLLGIGRNGHIGFNEPTSSLADPDQDPDRGDAHGQSALLRPGRATAGLCHHHGRRYDPRGA